jgi:hypothetical protein
MAECNRQPWLCSSLNPQNPGSGRLRYDVGAREAERFQGATIGGLHFRPGPSDTRYLAENLAAPVY